MSQIKTLKESVVINAGPTRIWTILTKPEFSCQYYFDLEIHSEWMSGSEVHWRKENSVERKGRIVGIIPGIFFEIEMIQSNDLTPVKSLTRFELQTDIEGIKLTVQYSVSADTESGFIYHRGICRAMLQKIKWLAEYS